MRNGARCRGPRRSRSRSRSWRGRSTRTSRRRGRPQCRRARRRRCGSPRRQCRTCRPSSRRSCSAFRCSCRVHHRRARARRRSARRNLFRSPGLRALGSTYLSRPPQRTSGGITNERARKRRSSARKNEAEEMQVDVVELMKEEEPEPEPENEVRELKRRRALGMYQTTENEAEVAAMMEACSRLREMPCRWFACTSVLNSLETLIEHLHEVHAQEDDDESSTCMWEICGESFLDWKQLEVHAELHALETIHCAHQDCEEVLRSPRELVAHNLGHAEENSALKPSTRPGAPQAPLPLPPVPESVVPTCMVLAPAVQMPEISEERHGMLGPWVARNICAPANVRARRYNAALPLRATGGKLQPDYEFVETSAMHYSSMPSRPARVREMADLDSKEVSDMLANGRLVLWPSDGGPQVDDDEMAVENMLQVDQDADIQNVA
ncbi:hypothetical protein FB451DRAFT_479721 [Mycena latifolia]|nr:hypothetical protein FB451DRAFT_479721 [Mycena latifolia]